MIADHQIAFVNLKFTFDGDWKRFHKVVQFSQCDEIYSIVLGFDGTSCKLPAEIHAGAIKMSVFGYDAESDTTVRATTVPITLNIRPSGFVGDDDTPILESGHEHENKDILDTTIASYTIEEQQKIENFSPSNSITRELKNLGVDVWFEKENLHSISSDGELMLSILASFAQEESKSVSDNMKWRIQSNFKKGMPCNATILGYRYENGVLIVEPKEAKIVRFIFEFYLDGEECRKLPIN